MRPFPLIAAVAIVALAGPTARADFQSVSLGQAGASGLDLGVFVTGPTVMNASNSKTTFQTNVGLANGASTNFSGGGTITGTLYKDPGATLQSNLSQQMYVNSIQTLSLAQAVLDVQTAASTAKALTPDQTYGAVGSTALTLTATGALNSLGGHDTVVDISSINITNPAGNLTISGGANDFFIINVQGSVTVSNGQITTTGGISNSHVLFNVLGNGVTLTNGTSVLDGTYLAPNVGQKITLAPGTVNGAIIGYTIQTSSGPSVNGCVYGGPPPSTPPPAGVPAPPSVVLAGIALGMGTFARRLRRRLSAA